MNRVLVALNLSATATFAAVAPPPPVVFQRSAEVVGRTASLDCLSFDGRVIGGSFVDGSRSTAFRHSPEGGFQILATDLPAGTTETWPNGMSDTGDILFGTLRYQEDSVDYREGFRWTTREGFQRLGQVAGSTLSYPMAISSNDRILAGLAAKGEGYTSTFWSEKGGLKEFPGTVDGFPVAAWRPAWISNNARALWATGTDGAKCVIRWTHGKPPVVYRDLPGGQDSIEVTAVTANGKEAFGHATTQNGTIAVRFTAKGQIEPLLPELTDHQTRATLVTPGGRFVVGDISPLGSSIYQPSDSFVLDLKTGRRKHLSGVIPHLPSSIIFSRFQAKAISGDGDIVIGHASGSYNSDDWKITGLKAYLIPKGGKNRR